MEKLHPKFRFCPVECEQGFNPARREKCEDCSGRKSDEKFERDTLAVWKRVLGTDIYAFTFEGVLTDLFNALNARELPRDQLSVRTARIIAVYDAEERFHKDKKDWKRNQEIDLLLNS